MQKEKNIRVTSGIPRTPTSSGGIGGSGAFTYPDLGKDGYDIAGSLLFEQNAYTENKYNNDIRNITQTVEAELAKTRAANLATGKPKADATTQELNALSTLLSRKTTEHQEQIRVANLFYGYDPLSHKGVDPSEKGFDVPPRTSERDFYIAVEKWNVSFAAAYRAKLLTAQIDIINTKVANLVRAVEKQIQVAYTERLLTIPQVLESELAAVRARGATDPVAPVAAITRELSVRDSHIAAKIAEANKLDKIANAFYGSDPTAKHIDNWIALYNTGHRDPEKLLEEWTASFSAAYIAKFVRVEIDVLNTQSVKVREFLVAVQANEAEAKRVASEQARVAAEAEAQRVAAEAEAKRIADEEAAYKNSVSFLAATNEQILGKYGANMSKVAQGLQTNISGKKIRSYSEALATFEKVNANPKIKLNAQDTQAVVDALNALDKATFADNVNRLGKAFGVVGKIVQADAICKKTIIGFKTGDWKPLGLEFESMAAGAVAGAAAGAVLAAGLALLGAPVIITVPAVAIVMAFVASFLDSEKVDEINGYFIK